MDTKNYKVGYYLYKVTETNKNGYWEIKEKYLMTTYSTEESFQAWDVLKKLYPKNRISRVAFVYYEGEENNGPKWKAGK